MDVRDDAVLIEEYRGALLENVHCGHVCVVGESGSVAFYVGNPEHVTYMRSSAKPMQAIAFFALGLDDKYDLNDQERTILAGSHQGAPYHIEALESIARKMRIDEDALVLLPTYPACQVYRDAAVAQSLPPRKFYHNCAGKHLATIAMAREFGQSEDTYYQTGTPVQNYLLDRIAQITGCSRERIVVGVDGCGVPVYGMPLSDMARGFLHMANPQMLENSVLREKTAVLARLMHENSRYINKEDYICTCMNEDPNILAKGGAQGVYCFSIKDRKQAVAFKISDGSEEEWQLVVWSVLEQLGCGGSIAARRMLDLRPFEIVNATGCAVGRYQPVFELAGA